MAAAKELRMALEVSRLRLTAVEERLILSALADIDKRIADYAAKDGEREAREPYEFS